MKARRVTLTVALAAVLATTTIPLPAAAYHACREERADYSTYADEVRRIEPSILTRAWTSLATALAELNPVGLATASKGCGGGGGGSGTRSGSCGGYGKVEDYGYGERSWAYANLEWDDPPCGGSAYKNLRHKHTWDHPSGWTVSTSHGCLGEDCNPGCSNCNQGQPRPKSQTITKPTENTWDAVAYVDL